MNTGGDSSRGRRFQSMLDECRMLILGTQVLLGAAAECTLESGFDELTRVGRGACAVQLLATVCAAAVLMLPVAFHRIAAAGREDEPCEACLRRSLAVGFAPLAAALGAAAVIVGERWAGGTGAAWLACPLVVCAAAAWYAWPMLMKEPAMASENEGDLEERIRHVLTESRIVLPGAQALLGFSVVGALAGRYGGLDNVLRAVHAAGFASVALAVVLLMAVPAYHRLADGGGLTERFHRVATRLLVCAMGAIACALAADTWLVMEVVTDRRGVGVACGCAVAFVCGALWFVWTALVRRARPSGPLRGRASSPALRGGGRRAGRAGAGA